MLFFLLSCFSFIILSKFSFFKTFPNWNLEMDFFSFQCFFKHMLKTSNMISHTFHNLDPTKNVVITSKTETLHKKDDVCLLDLPDLPLECILEKLSPAGLASMSGVCWSFRVMCTQDHLWERHLNQKWGKFLVGGSMYQEWQNCIDNKKKQKTLLDPSNGKGYFGLFITGFWWWKKNVKLNKPTICLPVDSVMSWYLSLESGKFSFPAQVYNRENGNIGFLLSCYDAKVTYDSHTDSFKARYASQGRTTIEENIKWERLRSPAVDTPPYDLHVSDCLNDLQPGDHFEIQWRKSKEFPYGWWFGVVGHLESCDGNKRYCQCHHSDSVILEFKQYNLGSRWREVVINRRDHREVGSEADGFYAGIRKLYNDKEIATWKSL